MDRARTRLVSRLRGEGKSLRQIADVVGVSEKAIPKQLRRLGWPAAKAEQGELPLTGPSADPKRSGSASAAEDPVALAGPGVDPKRSGSREIAEAEPLVVSADRDPANRWLTKLGLLDEAAPLFRDGERLPRTGVLLALLAMRSVESSTPPARSTARSAGRSTDIGHPRLFNALGSASRGR